MALYMTFDLNSDNPRLDNYPFPNPPSLLPFLLPVQPYSRMRINLINKKRQKQQGAAAFSLRGTSCQNDSFSIFFCLVEDKDENQNENENEHEHENEEKDENGFEDQDKDEHENKNENENEDKNENEA